MFSSDEKVQILATMNTWSNDNLREPSESSKEERVMKKRELRKERRKIVNVRIQKIFPLSRTFEKFGKKNVGR